MWFLVKSFLVRLSLRERMLIFGLLIGLGREVNGA